jgi:membrane-bound acyltransferase YfiQ involved in biofilm formation
MIFFYVGYILQKEDVSLDRFYTLKHCIILAVAFCVLFPTLTILRERLGDMMAVENQMVMKAAIASSSTLLRLIYSSVGLAMLFILIGYKDKDRTTPLPQWIIKVGNLCFGVYLLQQFILKGLYDYTNLPSILGCYWLPWVGFVVALVGSVLLAQLLLRTKTGRFLIG